MFPINTIIAWIINYYHKHEYANKLFYYCLSGTFPTSNLCKNHNGDVEVAYLLILLKGLPLQIASHHSQRNRHPSATYAIQVACQSWNRSLGCGQLKLVRAASIKLSDNIQNTRGKVAKKISTPTTPCVLIAPKFINRSGSDTTVGSQHRKQKKIPTQRRRNKTQN